MANPGQFFRSYLISYLFWFALALGSFVLLLIHHLTHGIWGVAAHPAFKSAAQTLPLFAVLFIPILFGLKFLYPWAIPEEVMKDSLLQHKSEYLNASFFSIRTGVYFFIWLGLLFAFFQSTKKLSSGTSFTKFLSGLGIILCGLAATFASVDWMMSLEPHWFSSMYGVSFAAGHILAALAFAIIITWNISKHSPFSKTITPQHFHDLGNLLLAFVMFWTYVNFSQFLIIWSGNLPEDHLWYHHRLKGGWGFVGIALVLFHFFLPFLALLFRSTKRKGWMVSIVAATILIMRWVDYFWLVVPPFSPQGPYIHWLDLITLLGIGGIWFGIFSFCLKRNLPSDEYREHYGASHD
jgi:hypothetical protein